MEKITVGKEIERIVKLLESGRPDLNCYIAEEVLMEMCRRNPKGASDLVWFSTNNEGEDELILSSTTGYSRG